MNCRVAFGCKGDRSTPVAGVLKLGEGPPQVLTLWLLGLETIAILVNENSIRFGIGAIIKPAREARGPKGPAR